MRWGIYPCGGFHAFLASRVTTYPVFSDMPVFFYRGKCSKLAFSSAIAPSLARLSIRPTSNRVGNFWCVPAAAVKRNSERFLRRRRRRKSSKKFGARWPSRPPPVYLHFTIHPRTLHFSEESECQQERSGEESGALPSSLRVQVLSFQLALPGILSFSPSPLLSSLPFLPLQEPSFLVGRRHFGSFVCLTF